MLYLNAPHLTMAQSDWLEEMMNAEDQKGFGYVGKQPYIRMAQRLRDAGLLSLDATGLTRGFRVRICWDKFTRDDSKPIPFGTVYRIRVLSGRP